ncbi:MAG: prepilin-type N-terminal cleavage/methylation domain-containing protein [Bacilli bacterium]|nr:prepilin-type N-terminal cleavage/methylation domain-containing protein [Bacilli bacterium]MDD4283043.1 prepilin-type N-terminal cleavage/methylation domain-containing protein [Bacilli bacterium]MDD4718565.1 prepilin-type N-terminal cleavage/methylation domain-containing protein [Bacilli bacterium]
MKVNKKGFTLIELLAVIVILAIIMLIATPAIVGVIEEARQGAARSSALGYIAAIEKHVMAEQLNTNPALGMNEAIDTDTSIPHRGEKPSSVSLQLSSGTVISGTIQFGDYIYSVSNGTVVLVET